MATILEITDGVTTIALNLAEGVSGFKLEGLEGAWQPTNPFYKGGGTWQQSPLADGRRLVDRRFENVIDTFRVHVEGTSQDDLITNMQNLKRLLEKAADYWATDWQDAPVDIKAKADNETNARYATIYTGRILQDGNPYACRFNGGVGSTNIYWMWDLTLIIEHAKWTENATGTSTAVELSAVEAFDGRNLGNVDSAGVRDPITTGQYVANKRNEANLTDIYVDDGGVFSANLMDAALPYNLLPAVPVVNDALYIGIDTAIVDSGPFASVVFDIGTGQTNLNGLWEYYNGAWITIPGAQDNTLGLFTTGINSLHFQQPSDWVTVAVNGVTGYWIRFRVSAIGGGPTGATQQNRDLYSIIWEYIEIQSDAILGDIVPLVDFDIFNTAHNGSNNLYIQRVLGGLRSISRGVNFTSFINFADEQNPTDITITIPVASSFAFANDVQTPTGRKASASINAGISEDIYIYITGTLADEYRGKFRVFARVNQTNGASGDVGVNLSYGSLNNTTTEFASGTVNDQSFTQMQGQKEVLDLGIMEINTTNQFGNIDSADVYMFFTFENVAVAARTIDAIDIFILPVDEYAFETFRVVTSFPAQVITAFAIDDDKYLQYGSIYPKNVLSILTDVTTDQGIDSYAIISAGKPIAQANTRQRFHFLTMRLNTTAEAMTRSEFENGYKITLERNQQYISMRGDR